MSIKEKDAERRPLMQWNDYLQAIAATVTAAAARMEVTMMSVMIRSPFRSFSIRFLFRGDQSDHDGCGGDDDSGNDEFHFSFSSLFCDLAAGSDQGNDNSGGSKDGSNYDSGHDFVPLSFLFFRGFSVPRRHPYNTTTRTKFVRVVIFNALFVIFDGFV